VFAERLPWRAQTSRSVKKDSSRLKAPQANGSHGSEADLDPASGQAGQPAAVNGQKRTRARSSDGERTRTSQSKAVAS
jgi:hypothetical protein